MQSTKKQITVAKSSIKPLTKAVSYFIAITIQTIIKTKISLTIVHVAKQEITTHANKVFERNLENIERVIYPKRKVNHEGNGNNLTDEEI